MVKYVSGSHNSYIIKKPYFHNDGLSTLVLQDSKHLTVSAVRNLKMNDDVVAVAVSPEGKHIAVALLDSTIKVGCCCSKYIEHWCFVHMS